MVRVERREEPGGPVVGEERVHGGLVFFPTDDDRYGRGKHSRAVLVS